MKRKYKLRSKIYIIVAFVTLGFFSFVLINNNESYTEHNNEVDYKISLNPERPLYKSVTETNTAFSNIAFAPVEKREEGFIDDQIASVYHAMKRFLEIISSNRNIEETKERGSWLWTPTVYLTENYAKEVILGAKERGVNVIYLSVDSYLDIYVMKESGDKSRRKIDFENKIENFIKIANENGILVDALGGWKNWAERGNEYKPFAILSFVKEFNDSNEYKFRGFQYDVEPYLLDKFEIDQASVLKNFVRLVDKTETFLSDTDIMFSVVIPDFYDRKDGVTQKFTYEGSSDYVIEHLIKILDRRKNNSVIVMSYRNFAYGEDGSIEVSKNEMSTFRKKARNTKIIIAQETGNFPPPFITFFNKSRNHLYSEITKIEDEFQNNPKYGGIAIHYINSYLGME